LAENAKLGEASRDGSVGPLVIEAVGAPVSTFQVAEATSLLPAASVALTWKVCDPSASLLKPCGLEQAAKLPESSLHWKEEPGSEELKVNVAVVALVGSAGPEAIDAVGAVRSTVQA